MRFNSCQARCSGHTWLALLLLCTATAVQAETHILIDQDATVTVRHAASELADDIRHAIPGENVLVRTFEADIEQAGINSIRVGRVDRGHLLTGNRVRAEFPLLNTSLLAETFVIQSAKGKAVVGGADDRGVLYGVYEFSRQVLGIDPLEFWTGKTPVRHEALEIQPIAHLEPAPVFKLRGYFDNDNDHLANWQGRKLIVEFETWKAMIDSLARLRYNYIDIHDLLGRPEYYLRDYYTQMTEYHTDLELVDQVIEYAHEKGLLVQVPMSLGWEFRHIDLDQVCLTEHHELWMDTFEYYLSETPIGKADLFLARPRHPIYDWQYSCPSEAEQGIPHGPLLEEVFADLGKLIERYQPGAQLVSDLWQEGRALWTSGDFSPDKTIQVLWADSGYAEFGGWPTDLKGYPMGIYIHAGVWHNQVVQDPYPARIGDAFREAAARGMTYNALVNGQSFKPFILNLEAAAQAMWNPESFDGGAFYQEWTTRYFGAAAAEATIESLELLHKAHGEEFGYRDITRSGRRILRNLKDENPKLPDLAATRAALTLARDSLQTARTAEQYVPPDGLDVFDDQVLFPITIYVQNLELLESLRLLNIAWLSLQGFDTSTESMPQLLDLATTARARLVSLLQSLEKGSRWKKWEDWYRPENFRIHTPPITLEEFDRVMGTRPEPTVSNP